MKCEQGTPHECIGKLAVASLPSLVTAGHGKGMSVSSWVNTLAKLTVQYPLLLDSPGRHEALIKEHKPEKFMPFRNPTSMSRASS